MYRWHVNTYDDRMYRWHVNKVLMKNSASQFQPSFVLRRITSDMTKRCCIYLNPVILYYVYG